MLEMNRRIKSILLIISVLVLVCASAVAQNSGDSVRVNLQKTIEIALSESPSMRIANRNIETKKHYKSEQIAALFPNVSLVANYNRTIKKQVMAMDFGGQNMEIEVGQFNTYTMGINASLPLIMPTMWSSIKLSQMDVNLAIESARASKLALITQVKKAYYTVLMTQESHRVLQQNLANNELNNKMITDKFEQGLVSEFEKLRSDVALQNMRPNVSSAAKAASLAQMMLKIVIGVDLNEPLIFDGSLADFEEQMLNEKGTNSNLSLENNTNLKQLDIALQQLQESKKMITASACPSLTMSGNYQYMSMSNDFNFSNYNWFPYSTIGFTLSVPIVSWAGTAYKLKQSKLAIENMHDQKLELQRNLTLSLQSNLNDIAQSVEDLASNKESMMQAEKAYNIVQKQYEIGMATWLDLNSAELALTAAQLSYNQCIFNYLSAYAALEEVLGKEN